MGHAPDTDVYDRLMPAQAGRPDPAQPGGTQAADQRSADVLRISPTRLRSVSGEADRLGSATRSARGRLEQAHGGLPAGSGFAAVGALVSVHASWDDRLAKITRDCGEIGDLLQEAARVHEANDCTVAQPLKPLFPPLFPSANGIQPIAP